jgi:predicted RNA polymerase sigma factor
VWAQIIESGEGEPAAAFEAFDVLTADGTCAMNQLFLALLADIETHYGRAEHAHELLIRAQSLSDATGERAWDAFVDQRLAVMVSSPELAITP